MVYSYDPYQNQGPPPGGPNMRYAPPDFFFAARQRERRKIRRYANRLWAIGILALVAAAVARALFAAPFHLADAVNGTARASLEIHYGWGVVLTQVLPVLLGELILLLLGYRQLAEGIRWRFPESLARPQKAGLTVFAGFACVGGGLAAALISYLFAYPLSLLGMNLYAQELNTPTQLGPRLAVTAFVYLLSPVLQELIFRGIFLNNLRRYGQKSAIFTTALLCAFFQLRFDTFLGTFLIGVVLGYLAVLTGDIRPVAIARVLAEAVMGLMAAAADAAGSIAFTAVYLVLMYLVLLAFMIVNMGKVRTGGSILTTGQQVGASLSGPCAALGIIAYILLNLSRLIGSSVWLAA